MWGRHITTVDTIQISGSGNLRLDTRSRPFAPGRTPETDGASEIEIELQTSFATIQFNLGSGPDVLLLTDTQGDFFGDGDLDDFTFDGAHRYIVIAGAGDDLIDGSQLVAIDATLMGGAGDDTRSAATALTVPSSGSWMASAFRRPCWPRPPEAARSWP